MGAMFKSKTSSVFASRGLSRREIWEAFRNNAELLQTYRVTPDELDFLNTVALMGNLSSVEDILFILKNIRASRGIHRF